MCYAVLYFFRQRRYGKEEKQMAGKLLLAVNPCAGKGQAKRILLDIVGILTDGGYEATVLPTKPGSETPKKIASLLRTNGYDLVVACGGDGTLHLVADGVLRAETHTPIGYIPLGTTNDFATSLNIPTSWRDATKALLHAKPVRHDIGFFNKLPYTYIACCGAFAETSFSTSQTLKNQLGHTAYLIHALPALTSLHPLQLEIEADDIHYAGPFLFCALANTRSVAGMVHLKAGQVHFQDGKFELLLIRYPNSMLEAGRLAKKLLASETDDPLLSLHHVSACKIRSKTPVSWSLDGEDGGKHTEVSLSVEKSAIYILKSAKTS